MMNKLKNKSGITLVALVVTVILLLILAGITLKMTIGENGIIQKAMEAKENMIKASKEEENRLNALWAELENENNIGGSSIEEDKKDEITDKDAEIADLKNQVTQKQEQINTLQNELDNLKSVLLETTAESNHILTGYKAYSGGKLLTGMMPNRGNITQTLNAGESYTIPEGYHNGSGKVIANTLVGQTPQISYSLYVWDSEGNNWGQITVPVPQGYTKVTATLSAYGECDVRR